MQVYKYMDIGSAKVTVDEMDGIKHYLIDELEPSDEFNVFIFKDMAKKALNEIYEAGKIPIVVGGTGFYIQALLYDIDFTKQDVDEAYRKSLYDLPTSTETMHCMKGLRISTLHPTRASMRIT